ncbi:MAG: MurR/RpiR family transcriptional regulator [Spirochaetes bacterium]|jgi:DNA-binding MurR/RpiR family transcriptional regulator|nr:MurR/RpiR family transcriptional regulator [Spirochaetota bacterium]
MTADWMDRLRQFRDALTRAEAVLVDYVNTHPDLAVRSTQLELAEHSGVSKPTIISCFRKLQFSSFRDFQASVERFFATQIDSLLASRSVHERVNTIETLIREAAAVDARALERLSEALPASLLEEIAVRMHQARTVFVMGPSTGHYPAHYLSQRLLRYGIFSVLIHQDPRHVPDMLHPMGDHDALVLFHYGDDDAWLYRILSQARERDTWTALVSAVIHPTYVEASDAFVHVPRGEMQFKNSMAVPMHFANLLLLTYELLFREHADAQLTQLESTRRVWSDPAGEKIIAARRTQCHD